MCCDWQKQYRRKACSYAVDAGERHCDHLPFQNKESGGNLSGGQIFIVSAVGKVNTVTADMVKEGAILIDVGMNRNEAGKLCGDVDLRT